MIKWVEQLITAVRIHEVDLSFKAEKQCHPISTLSYSTVGQKLLSAIWRQALATDTEQLWSREITQRRGVIGVALWKLKVIQRVRRGFL